MPRVLSRIAPAKINLYLHVTGKREDGYHLLDSVVVFAQDVGDRITISGSDTFSFNLSGPMSGALQGEDSERNLAVRAARLYCNEIGTNPDFSLHLEKNLPSGAGLGGGSADAAAVIRALEDFFAQEMPDRDDHLLSLGADVPVCYHGHACRIRGIGERLYQIPALPSLHMLLVWPNAHTATKDVFDKRDDITRDDLVIPRTFGTTQQFIQFLKTTGNDLSEAAESLSPVISEARAVVAAQRGCALVRMSGSGSAVFGLFEHAADCSAAQRYILSTHPDWWAKQSRL